MFFRNFAGNANAVNECLGIYYMLNGRLAPCSSFDEVLLSHPKYIYEVFRVIGGIPLFLEDHLDRLVRSVSLTGHAMPWVCSDIEAHVARLIDANTMKDGNIKLVFRPSTANLEAVMLIYITEHQYPTQRQYNDGVEVVLFEGVRDNPNAKVMDVALRRQTNEVKSSESVYETLFVDEMGFITEGSRSNVFFITDAVVVTPPVGDVLPGITRKYIIACCRDMGITIREEKVHVSRLAEFDAVFISGTSRRVLPVNRINDQAFSPGHRLTRDIQHAFNNKLTIHLLRAEMGKRI